MTQLGTSKKFRICDALRGVAVTIGGEQPKGQENAETRVALVVFAQLRGSDESQQESGGVEEVQIWLTIPQIAAIIWWWFAPILPVLYRRKEVFTQLLERLMKQRWKIMTSPMAKGNAEGGAFTMPHYFRKPGSY